jgi:hypothetical protein
MTVAHPDDAIGELGEYPTIFREFLYADVERARSLLAQRLGGVPEEFRTTDGTVKHLALGAQRYLGMGRETKAESYEQRSLLDAVFPVLEEVLEVEQWLTDITDIVESNESTDPDILLSAVSPGSLVRLTGSWQLFDASYVAHTLAGTAAAADGIASLAPQEPQAPPGRSGGRNSSGGRKPRETKSSGRIDGSPRLEDMIEDYPAAIMGGVEARQFRAMVKVSRGLFAESGLHVLLSGPGRVGWTVTARLQRGRQYLDAEPDILFSRYGTSPLQWTVVGTIGHFANQITPNAGDKSNLLTAAGTMNRAKFVGDVNRLMSYVANQGFADVPPFPGFSIVPLAVYRLIPKGRP